MHILSQSLKQLVQAGIVYLVLIFGYSLVSEAASCVTFQNYYLATTPNGAANTVVTVMRGSGTDTPENCGAFVMTSSEYVNLVKNRIDTANTNINTLQANDTTLQNNLVTVNTSLQTVSDQTFANKAKIEEIESLLQNIGPDGGIAIRDQDNILHITHEDALTLFYAVMGLFATAFVWRFARNSLTVADTYAPAE
jgi:tRNA/tmRNA/rRNA uracil-C5-methylase (TrmA/RlmC/RlmD family)